MGAATLGKDDDRATLGYGLFGLLDNLSHRRSAAVAVDAEQSMFGRDPAPERNDEQFFLGDDHWPVEMAEQIDRLEHAFMFENIKQRFVADITLDLDPDA